MVAAMLSSGGIPGAHATLAIPPTFPRPVRCQCYFQHRVQKRSLTSVESVWDRAWKGSTVIQNGHTK